MEGSGDYCNTTEAVWLHRKSPERECEAQQVTAGSLCGATACAAPVRPRGGWVTPFGGVIAGTCELSWWVADLDPRSVRVLRKFDVSDVPPPIAVLDSLKGKGGTGQAKVDDVPSIADGGEALALWADGYGVLDVMVVASQSTTEATLKTDDHVNDDDNANGSRAGVSIRSGAGAEAGLWKPTWRMNESTIMLWRNASGLNPASDFASYGVVMLDWAHGAKHWINDYSPMSDGASLAEQCALIKATSPGTKCVVYR